MVRINKVVTRGGDNGDTSLGNGQRVGKDVVRVEAYGTVDEANAAIGVLRLHTGTEPMDASLAQIQNELFDVGADLCVPDDGTERRLRLQDDACARLEAEIAEMNARLPPLTSFILPAGAPPVAHAHLARTIVRRAERHVVALSRTETVNPVVIRYLNRLSDFLFVFARYVGKGDAVLWQPGKRS